MQRIKTSGTLEVMPTLEESSISPGFFGGGNPSTGQLATVIGQDWLNGIQEELVNVIHEGGIQLDAKDNTQLKQAIYKIFENINPLIYPGAVFGVYKSEPPTKCAAAHGQLLSSVNTTAPLLLDNLLNNPDLQDLKCTEAEWQAIYKNDAVWRGNVGACGYFVLDTANNTIRLPDLRGLVAEFAGFDGLVVGRVHGDMIRNIVGTLRASLSHPDITSGFSGAFGVASSSASNAALDSEREGAISFNTSRVVPTGAANKPRAVGFLPCVYLG